MDLNDVWRNRIVLYVLRDLDAKLHRRVEPGRRDLVLVENADNLVTLLGRKLRGTRSRALTRCAADIDTAVDRAWFLRGLGLF